MEYRITHKHNVYYPEKKVSILWGLFSWWTTMTHYFELGTCDRWIDIVAFTTHELAQEYIDSLNEKL